MAAKPKRNTRSNTSKKKTAKVASSGMPRSKRRTQEKTKRA